MKISVVIPCLNEEITIAKVIADAQRFLPQAEILVFDNGSEDATALKAKKAGAKVISVPERGKGNVLRQAFHNIDADYVVLIDGDGTYPMNEAPRLIDFARRKQLEMVMGSRLELGLPSSFRRLHYSGNLFFSKLVRVLFNHPITDLLTGFRVFSRRFLSEVQLQSQGFEVETEMTLRALNQNLPFAELAIPYAERPQGGKSKLRTFRDGWAILKAVFKLWFEFRRTNRKVKNTTRERAA